MLMCSCDKVEWNAVQGRRAAGAEQEHGAAAVHSSNGRTPQIHPRGGDGDDVVLMMVVVVVVLVKISACERTWRMFQKIRSRTEIDLRMINDL
ncbi:hypothetical protein C0J50_0512 [Silurus asotus]|uniref:Uncharacterized protein n=1 Tax=Silurus asotus TaxID=30991 RepID=A0AAD5A9Q5_SILAS|nr:hypothetical protein C0J50_0512 [Silurus asotus]